MKWDQIGKFLLNLDTGTLITLSAFIIVGLALFVINKLIDKI